MKKLITIFGPSRCNPESLLYQTAERLGTMLADSGFGVVSGGYEGVMEAVSKGAYFAGGTVIAVTAEVYSARGREPNVFRTREVKVKSAVDRLMELLDLADAYIACGISPGTLIEVATAWDYMIKRFMNPKPLILIGDEWKGLCDTLFAQDSYKGMEHVITFATNPKQALDMLLTLFGKQMKLPDLSIL